MRHNAASKVFEAYSFKTQKFNFERFDGFKHESLILAQNERWRQA